jgi:hypothetical protein
MLLLIIIIYSNLSDLDRGPKGKNSAKKFRSLQKVGVQNDLQSGGS